MDNIWFASALWIGLALTAASLQAWVAVSVALLEIIIGGIAGNLVDMPLSPWVNYLAGFGAILLAFLAAPRSTQKSFAAISGRRLRSAASSFLRPISASSPGLISSRSRAGRWP